MHLLNRIPGNPSNLLQAREGVVVVGATNRPDAIDGALLRPGRFDRLVRVHPPDAAERAAILRVHTRSTPLAPEVNLQASLRLSRQRGSGRITFVPTLG